MFTVRRTAVLLACIVVLSTTLRLAMIFALATYRSDAGAYEHAEIAASLVRGEGFSFAFFHHEPLVSSHQAPAIPLLLAAAYAVFGIGSPMAYLMMQLANVVLGAAATLAIYSIARRLWNERVGLWAAGGFAVYLPLVYMATRIQSINWSIGWLLITLAMMIALRDRCARSAHIQGAYAPRSPGWLAVAVGVCAAIGILGEPILLLPLAMFWLLPLGERLGGKPIAWRSLIIAGVAAAVVMAPWSIRNYCVHGKLMAVKSTFWYVFWQGNNRHATGVDKLAPDQSLQRSLAWRVGGSALETQMHEARTQAASVDTTLTRDELLELHALPSEVEKVAWFEQRAKAALAQDPAHYLSMCLRRLAINLWFDPTNPRSYVLAYRAPFLLLAALAIVGLVRGVAFERPRDWLLPVLMFATLLLVFTGVITSARFRLLLEAFLFLPAALAATSASQRMLFAQRKRKDTPPESAKRRLAA